jgi:hypothetical protein
MKVKIGPYINYFGPYQIAETILFWLPREHDKVYALSKWLADKDDGSPTFLAKFCEDIHSKRQRSISIKIDRYDTWNMDETISRIIIPLLKQLKERKHGIPSSILFEVAEASGKKYEDFHDDDIIFNAAEKRWNEILDKMIWAFEQNITDWEDQYWTVKPEMDFSKHEEDEGLISIPVRWKKHGVHDSEGHKAHYAKMEEGFMLFGKHFKDLWD